MAIDVYKQVTDKIIAQLEAGTSPWSKSWSGGGGGLPLRHCGTPYKGVNVLLLWSEAQEKGYTSNIWMTFKQALALGGAVRKGEKAAHIVYANTIVKKETNDAGDDVERAIPFLKGYCVFNTDQIDGLPAQYYPAAPVKANPVQLIEAAEEFFRNTGATVNHGGGQAYYRPSTDSIQLPKPEQFRDAESYTATKAHEFIHWTGADHRLARDFSKSKRFGDEHYAAEELVAEIGAAFLCAVLGVSSEPREDHASYLAGWLRILKQDKRAIFTAATQAQKAADYLQSLQQPMAIAA